MKAIKSITNRSSVSRITVTLYECDSSISKPYLIEVINEKNSKSEPYSIKTVNEEYNDYFRSQYRFLQLAMLYLS